MRFPELSLPSIRTKFLIHGVVSCTGLSTPTGNIFGLLAEKPLSGGQELDGRESALVVHLDQAVYDKGDLGVCQSPQRHLDNTSKSVPYY